MASTSTSSMDMLVSVKVILDGSTRRFKRPLGDLGAKTLETQLRKILEIPNDTECLIERYSDSGAAYVVLDSTNVSVYKQLYRAAKAKQKLKLRITTNPKTSEEEEKKGPLPASVEDEPEAAAAPAPAQLINPGIADKPAIDFPFISAAAPPQPSFVQPQPVQSPSAAGAAKLRSSLALIEQEHQQMEQNLEAIQASIAAVRSRHPSARSSPDGARSLDDRKSSNEYLLSLLNKPTQPTFNTSPDAVGNFAVCCNSCDETIPDAHYHCSTCDDGDFDLCQDCVNQGITCHGSDHWLLKRFVRNGVFVNSTTETIAPKPKVAKINEQRPTSVAAPPPPPAPRAERIVPVAQPFPQHHLRTCNSCVRDLPEHKFLHCTTCADFDLCTECMAKNQHGHHPKHAFVPVAKGLTLEPEVSRKLAPGRNQRHNAICDGCDKDVVGVRHKCLDCPDWDYCASCVVNARFIHPGHRFVPVYEPLESPPSIRMRACSSPTHVGICCDGPLCHAGRSGAFSSYIVGTRYKCAVCYDTDFCANCEASPANTHNKTHPLIKFKTPVKGVTVTTTGQNKDGEPLPAMGDQPRPSTTSSRSTETTVQPQEIVRTNMLTVADVKPSEPATPVEVKQEIKQEPEITADKVADPADLIAIYKGDTVSDGTVLPRNHVFEQTWIIRNEGNESWPAGCAVKFVGGDFMGHVNRTRPVGVQELASASESSICEAPIAPQETARFTVTLRTPNRDGRIISYWRLTTKDGFKFGPRLWCDVNVKAYKAPEEPVKEQAKEAVKDTPAPAVVPEPKVEEPTEPQGSQMIFPKLEKESPAASIHAETKPEEAAAADHEEYEDCEDVEWSDHSEEGFLTDEEYDILDASDEEFLGIQDGKVKK